MKLKFITLSFAAALLFSCNDQTKKEDSSSIHLNGTWKLVSGETITKGVVSTSEYPKNQEMIKVINDTHFAFLNHRINLPKDSVNHFDAGGGSYTLVGDKYTEHLDYYSDRNWEGKAFDFTISIKGDTLIQTGIEKVEKAGIERKIIEKYLKIK
jgi:hypothetical protein